MTAELKRKISKFDSVRNELCVACGLPEFPPEAKKPMTMRYGFLLLALLIFFSSCAMTYCPQKDCPSVDSEVTV